MLEYELSVLEKKLPVETDGVLNSLLEAVYRIALKFVGGRAHYECGAAGDAERVLRRHFEALAARVNDKNAELLRASQGVSDAMVDEAVATLQKALLPTAAALLAQHPHGYLRSLLELSLNERYCALEDLLNTRLAGTPHAARCQERFNASAVGLCQSAYTAFAEQKAAALQMAVQQARRSTSEALSSFDTDELWSGVAAGDRGAALSECLDRLAAEMEQSVRQGVDGWMSAADPSAESASVPEVQAELELERGFVESLRAAIQREVGGFLDMARVQLQRKEEASMDVADDEWVEEESDWRAPLTVAERGAGKGSSAAEQRLRAQDWAQQQLGISTAAKGRGKGKVKVDPKVPKSVEQQRRDALEYAEVAFGDAVRAASPPPASSSACLDAPSSPSWFSAMGWGSGAAAQKSKGGLLQVAREEALQAAKQRAEAAAAAAAERIVRNKAKKSKD
ncbi:hypothetical protein B484DRAFT_183241 [Ochromonadaceae sp. CCMP2298]|nr:hypothetical protein B484DRAFT_183241 [Ochromonadaceae sp. CCMP2298]